jgi:hypothetical protein
MMVRAALAKSRFVPLHGVWSGMLHIMRRSIDDYPFSEADRPAGDEDAARLSWAISISDDYDDAEPRVVLTLEEVGLPGEGLVAHLPPHLARRLRGAIHDALKEIGEDPGR